MEYYTVIRPGPNELYHHGIKGMKWGVRRYQNDDGSLTAAGKRKRISEQTDAKIKKMKEAHAANKGVDKAKAKAEARLAKAEAKYGKKTKESKDSKEDDSKSKPKSVSEMSNEEIAAKIERIRLENTLNSLQPKQVSKGKQFMNSLVNDVITPAAKNVGKQYLEKTLKDALGLNEKNKKSLEEMAKEAGFKKQIAEAESAIRRYEKEKAADKAAAKASKTSTESKAESKSEKKQQSDSKTQKSETSSNQNSNAQKTESASKQQNDNTSKQTKTTSKQEEKVYTGTVEGEGTSKFTYSKNSSNYNTGKSYYDDIIDAEWSEVGTTDLVVYNNQSTGQNYLTKLLTG